MYRIHIVPGWAEGNWHFKQLSKAFGDQFKLEHDFKKADIVFAHSSGIYSLPSTQEFKLIILVDPPYWPGRNIINRVIQNVITDIPKQINTFGISFWLKLRFWNIVYILIEPWRHIKVWRSIKKTMVLAQKADKVILVRDKEDAYCGHQVSAFAKEYNLPFYEVLNLHEECWHNSRPYIDLILKELQ